MLTATPFLFTLLVIAFCTQTAIVTIALLSHKKDLNLLAELHTMVSQILQEQTKDLKAIGEITRNMNDYAMTLHARQAVTDEVVKVMMANAVDLAQAKIDLVNAMKDEAAKGEAP
ncbi:MAG: hypothetical protein A2Y78_06745 [Acidobacteria bacterium RBG_13_68_16]|nr:MAG: hypothetical protein A2Y78_06745 [Acidobacteria bacterium RBG_13_68_16]